MHIGTIENVSLPDDAIYDVPAKIDTGADSSAIWASNIKLTDGVLAFNFFAPGSAYYREEPVTTTAFKKASVKNSFGHEETRYKVRLRVSVGSITVTRWFSLADRSRNTYPILLGKNFLHKRFVVDVSQRYLISEGPKNAPVLVVGSQKNSEFFDQVSQYSSLGLKFECIGYSSLIYHLDGLNTRVMNGAASNKDIAEYGLVYFKSHNQNIEFALAATMYLHFKGRAFIDRELRAYIAQSKLTEYMKLTCFDLPVPVSICAKVDFLLHNYHAINNRLGSPFVLKEIHSDQGKNNYLIANEKDFKYVLQQAPPQEIYLAQKYIDNNGFMRLYVMGKEVVLAIWRATHGHEDPLKVHLNKPLGGENATQVKLDELPPELRKLAIRSAICMDRQIAGVDLVQDKHSGAWYILEVNNGPQLRSGSAVEEKARALARYFDKELKR